MHRPGSTYTNNLHKGLHKGPAVLNSTHNLTNPSCFLLWRGISSIFSVLLNHLQLCRMPSKLPQELVNHITNFTHGGGGGDKKTLASASRVSRTWLTWLTAFQKITIRNYSHQGSWSWRVWGSPPFLREVNCDLSSHSPPSSRRWHWCMSLCQYSIPSYSTLDTLLRGEFYCAFWVHFPPLYFLIWILCP